MKMSDNQTNSAPNSPPHVPEFDSDLLSDSVSFSNHADPLTKFSILHFNCKNSIQLTHEALTQTQHTVIGLQEPWFNTHSLAFPQHPSWHRISAYDYFPKSWSDRPRVCMYITKRIPTNQIIILPSLSDIILAVEIKDHQAQKTKLKIISWYNPPGSARGFMSLEHWLSRHHQRLIPTVLLTDSNLHHQLWNPPGYSVTDAQAKKLIALCSSNGLKLASPRGVATRFSTNTQPTTIDLIWSSWNLTKNILCCKVLTEGISSDHFPLEIVLNLSIIPSTESHISFKIADLDTDRFHRYIKSHLTLLPPDYATPSEINEAASMISDIILRAAQDQGRKVKTKHNRHKAWWDKERLTPILKNRNRARRWMLTSNLPEAHRCYAEWQRYFKDQVLKAKFNHWKSFLANCSGVETFKAFRYVKPNTSSEIAPLRKNDGSIATHKSEQASVLFHGTSVAQAEADLSDIPSNFWDCFTSTTNTYQNLEIHELKGIVKNLPSKKANGDDCLSNELIKLALPAFEFEFCRLVNACFRHGFFPNVWRNAITVIIRKHGKDSYSEAGSYRPIALLSCLGKVLEKVITNRLTYWAETCRVIAPGHMGGRRIHSTDDALLILTSWIKEKWRRNQIVTALFLDVKSAYPSVHRERLWHTLSRHNCPLYLLNMIRDFLSERTTNIRLQDFLSDRFDIENGLPQGSPLSVILYIIYNSSLLSKYTIDPSSNVISLGFIDDVVHLVSSTSVDENLTELDIQAKKSLDWGRTHGAIFDKKKAQLIHFTTKRKVVSPNFSFGEVTLEPKQVVKWLGVWFDTKLLFNHHIQQMKKLGEFTINQLQRLSKCYSGLSSREVKKLIITVLIPRILYGSITWLTTRNFTKANRVLESLQHSAQRLILGAFRGTSSEMLEHDSYMLPFHSIAAKSHHKFLLKRLTAPDFHPTHRFINFEMTLKARKHKGPIQDVLHFEVLQTLTRDRIETIFAHSFGPWTPPLGSLHNLNLSKEEAVEKIKQQLKEESNNNSIVIFTDGSVSPEGGGAAAASTTMSLQQTISQSCRHSNHEAELIGIRLAAQLTSTLLKNQRTFAQDVAIFSDNQGVLRLIHDAPRATTGQHIIINIRSIFRTLPENLQLKFYWTPGHAGITLNEEADTLAKEATKKQDEGIFLPSSLGSLKQEVNKAFNVKWLTLKPGKNRYRTKPKDIAKSLLDLERGRSSAIFQLRAGHSPLNAHLFRRDLIDSPLCDHCKKIESTDHFLLYCSRFKKARREFRLNLKKEKIKVNWNNSIKLLDSPQVFSLLSDFILRTKRFVHFHTYKEQKHDKGSRGDISGSGSNPIV